MERAGVNPSSNLVPRFKGKILPSLFSLLCLSILGFMWAECLTRYTKFNQYFDSDNSTNIFGHV
jgi:hypothetical protein